MLDPVKASAAPGTTTPGPAVQTASASPAAARQVDTTPVTHVAAFFDLDKTIIAGSSTLAFSGPLRARGLIGRRAMVRSGYAQLRLMVAGADAAFMDRMREQISALCTGWDAAAVRAVIEESLSEVLVPMIYPEAAALIEQHRALGHPVALISASGMEMVSPVAAALGAKHCVATRMTVAEGLYTGEIEFYCYGEGKAIAARELAAEHGYRLEDSHAYSDSITDLPLLEAVGHPHAVNPDRELREVAMARGWPVLDFVAPVRLHTRVRDRARSLLPEELTASPVAAWGVGGVAAALVLSVGWRVRRRSVSVAALA
jgi:HAD superfamily hydrolase (TIGR01490 family)